MKNWCVSLFLFVSLAGYGADCSLTGVAVSDKGTPVPGVNITVMSGGFRVGNYRSMRTLGDGTFTFKDLPCGKYTVSASSFELDNNFSSMFKVDTRKQSKLQVTVPGVDPLAAALSGYPKSEAPVDWTSSRRTSRQPTPEEEESVAPRRREYFERIRPGELAKFDAAELPEKKRMFVMAVGAHMAQMEGMTVEPPEPERKASRWRGFVPAPIPQGQYVRHAEEDRSALKKLANAGKIVRQTLPPEDAAKFANAPEIERASLFLRAVSLLPPHAPGCGMYGLYMADMDGFSAWSNAGASMTKFLGDPEVGRWEDLDIDGRCKVFDRLADMSLKMARNAEADGSTETLKSAVAWMWQSEHDPKRTVLEAFGNAGLVHYEQTQSVERKTELLRAAMIMQLSWTTLYMRE